MGLQILDGPVIGSLKFRRVPVTVKLKPKKVMYEIDLADASWSGSWDTLSDGKRPARFYDRSTALRAAKRFAKDRAEGRPTRYTV